MFRCAKSIRRVVLATTLGLIVMAAPPARGGTFNDVQMAGLWSNPVLSGTLYTVNPTTYAVTTQQADNTATAVYSLIGNMIQWGSGSSLLSTASSVTFVGNSFQTLPLNRQTALGTLTYLNGESDTGTLIFGATLTLSVPSTSIVPLPAQLGINTTSNSGLCDLCDSDYISFLLPVQLDKTLNVFEGQTATFILYGSFSGDPTIQLTDVVLAPGQTGGFVGNGTGSPEPGSLILFGGSLAVIAILDHLRKRRPERG